jgi:hypothetical protein
MIMIFPEFVGEDHVLYNVWKVSFERLDSDEKVLLGMMCLLSPDQIPISLFELDEGETPPIPMLGVCSNHFR